MMQRSTWWLAVLAIGLGPAAAAEAPARLAFNRDIRPILSDHCFQCHGPDAGHREAELRLDVREGAIAKGAIVPGDVAASGLVARIRSADPEEVMPPPAAHKDLDPAKKETLARWIAEGAEYQRHWAYEPPKKTAVPAGANGVDHLIDARLAARGLAAVGEADKRTLARRLSFDLLGLPPTPEEVAAFEADASAGAYESFVERLLASPHYGERMAVGWLDVVRFADTIGYHSDNPRNVWRYRDWVIAAFNANKPFDRFTIEQLAGDLLPDADVETRVGSAFNRLLLTTEEGGAQPKDYEARMLTDRVRAVGTVWLGQTTGCAQCHDHKFDPITMQDFYALGAFFADIQEPILGRREDGMVAPLPAERERLAALEQAVGEARREVEGLGSRLEAAQREWEAEVAAGRTPLAELVPGAQAKPEEAAAATAVRAALAKPAGERSPPEAESIRGYFRGRVSKLEATARERLAAAEKGVKDFQAGLPRCLVTTGGPPRVVRILPRGNWMDESQPPIKPALPSFLPRPTIEGRDPTRLDLATWLVARDNPLTPRVAMNRLWKQFFGTGLSRNLEDLGSQGEPPTNPELLDWLACEFMDSGWDMKHMVRTIVSSRAYRRSSVAPAALVAADPANRELARQSAFRIDAEFVRDSALATSGLLVRTIGGPSVKPYQPAGYWENLNFPVRDYPVDSGERQHRRGLYTWWQRSFLHPAMLALDAPSREECCAERTRSNIPQQALVLLNDPSFVEAARVLATATITARPAAGPEERIAWAWQRVLQRLPRQEEMAAVLPLVEAHLAHYRAQPAAAADFLKTGQVAPPAGIDAAELAAWTHVARVLLNLHETITRS